MKIEDVKFRGKDEKGAFSDIVTIDSSEGIYNVTVRRLRLSSESQWQACESLIVQEMDSHWGAGYTQDKAKEIAEKLDLPYCFYSWRIFYIFPDSNSFWFESPNKDICPKCRFFKKSDYGECELVMLSDQLSKNKEESKHLVKYKVPLGCPYELEISLA